MNNNGTINPVSVLDQIKNQSIINKENMIEIKKQQEESIMKDIKSKKQQLQKQNTQLKDKNTNYNKKSSKQNQSKKYPIKLSKRQKQINNQKQIDDSSILSNLESNNQRNQRLKYNQNKQQIENKQYLEQPCILLIQNNSQDQINIKNSNKNTKKQQKSNKLYTKGKFNNILSISNNSILQKSANQQTLDSSNFNQLFIGNQTNNQKIIKPKNKVKQIKKQQSDNQSQQSQQYIIECTPGPGSYDIQNIKKQFRSQKDKFKKIFISGLQRFKQSHYNRLTTDQNLKIKYQEQFDKKIQQERLKQGCHSFLSKSPKFQKNVQNISPPPGAYYRRDTLQHDLVRNVMKSSNSNVFISQAARLCQSNNKSTPGPGFYNVETNDKIIDQKDKLSYYNKSNQPRLLSQKLYNNKIMQKPNLQNQLNCFILNQQGKKSNILHQKIYNYCEFDQIYHPPFLSSIQRFPKLRHYKSTQINFSNNTRIINTLQLKKPGFNSSENRLMNFGRGQGVGVGLYNFNSNILPKSFNILYNA